MAFSKLETVKYKRFNTQEACNFLEIVEEATDRDIKEHIMSKPSTSITPSSIRCKRKIWFKCRGQEPDNTSFDTTMEWKASIGTSVHQLVQQRLIKFLGNDWIKTSSYLSDNKDEIIWAKEDNYSVEENGLETKVHIFKPDVSFSVDGIVKMNDKIYLLEIKSVESTVLQKLDEPREKDKDQIKTYCSLLHLNDVLLLYVDRSYGWTKCFSIHQPDYVLDNVWNQLLDLEEISKSDVAPEGLKDKNDLWCRDCQYRHACNQYG